jgi:hypothetical protein
VDKKKFMCGWETVSKSEQELIVMIIHLVKFGVYKCKLRYVLPTFSGLRYEVEEFLKVISKRQKWSEVIRDLSDIMRKILVEG